MMTPSSQLWLATLGCCKHLGVALILSHLQIHDNPSFFWPPAGPRKVIAAESAIAVKCAFRILQSPYERLTRFARVTLLKA